VIATLLALLALAAPHAANGTRGATVTLPMEAQVHGLSVELGELAAIDTADAALLDALSKLDLGYSPAPGHSRVLLAERIAAEIRRVLPDAKVALAGHAACRVRAAVSEIAAESIRAAAQAELVRLLGATDAELEPAGDIVAVEIPASEQGYELRARVTTRHFTTGAASVPVQVYVGGNLYRTVWTSWRLQVFETVPVLARTVEAGEAFRITDFERRRVPVSSAGVASSLAPEALVGAVAARDLVEGSVVTGHDVHRPVAVETGRTVVLEVKKGPIEARVAATARGSGAVGDRVRVTTLDGQRELTGVVVGRDVVREDLGS
jgi:flagella basal body P-ring formation protein FlgA